jgi:hypothetical protein
MFLTRTGEIIERLESLGGSLAAFGDRVRKTESDQNKALAELSRDLKQVVARLDAKDQQTHADSCASTCPRTPEQPGEPARVDVDQYVLIAIPPWCIVRDSS